MKKEKDLPRYRVIKVSDVILPQLKCLNGALMEDELNRRIPEIMCTLHKAHPFTSTGTNLKNKK